MATTIIYQRTRENQVVKFDVITTANVCTGLEYDGHFLWLCDGANFIQCSVNPIVQVRTTALTGGIPAVDEICFDGEFFWGAMNANNGIGRFTREGQLQNPVGGITAASLEGICFDGEYHWAHYFDALGTGGSVIVQVEHQQPSGVFYVVRSFGVPPRLQGLVFDGEFLIGKTISGGLTRDLWYFDRGTGATVKTVVGEPSGGDQFGLAFDGEYLYTMLSV